MLLPVFSCAVAMQISPKKGLQEGLSVLPVPLESFAADWRRSTIQAASHILADVCRTLFGKGWITWGCSFTGREDGTAQSGQPQHTACSEYGLLGDNAGLVAGNDDLASAYNVKSPVIAEHRDPLQCWMGGASDI